MKMMDILYTCAMSAIGVVLLMSFSYLIYKVFNKIEALPEELATVLLLGSIILMVIGVICLEVYFYNLWFGGL